MSEEHPSAIRLDALHMGEADPEAAAHLAECADCAAYLRGLEAEAAEFQREAHGDFVDAALGAEVIRGPARWWGPVALTLAAAAAVALFVLPPTPPVDPGLEPVQIKGGVALTAVVLHAGEQRRAGGLVEVVAGDRIRFEVTVAKPGPVTVGLLDAKGRWTHLARAREFEAGVHALERTLAVDPKPTDVRVLAGAPEAVAKARRGEAAAVAELRIRSQ